MSNFLPINRDTGLLLPPSGIGLGAVPLSDAAGAAGVRVFDEAIERATHDSVAFRYIAGNEHPDHDTIADFRKHFLSQLRSLFAVLRACEED
jgi:hypothetical protein